MIIFLITLPLCQFQMENFYLIVVQEVRMDFY